MKNRTLYSIMVVAAALLLMGTRDFDRAVSEAAKKGNVDRVVKILSRTSDPELASARREMALVIAARAGHDELCLLLLDQGADIEVRDDSERTPLTAAVVSGNIDLVHALLARGANVNPAVPWPPLHAALSGQVEMARVLLDAGADVNALDKHERTILDLASIQVKTAEKKGGDVERARELVDLLEKAGAVESFVWHEGKGLFLAFALAFWLSGLIHGRYGVRMLLKARSSRSWPTAHGEIVESRVEKKIRVYKRWQSDYFLPVIEYAFPVGDDQCTGNVLFFGHGKYPSQSYAEATVASHPQGKAVEVSYNPKNREESVLEPGRLGSRAKSSLQGGVLLVVIAVAATYALWAV